MASKNTSKRTRKAPPAERATTVVGVSLDDADLARLDRHVERVSDATGVRLKRGTAAAALVRKALSAEESA